MKLKSEDELYHHGIKGQKWGRRRYRYDDGTLTPEGREHYGRTLKTNVYGGNEIRTKSKSGKDITLEEIQYNKGFAKWLRDTFDSVCKDSLNSEMYNIKVDGKEVGEIELFQEDDESVNVVWLGVRDEERGKGYATAALDAAIDEAKSKGYKRMTLEVPGISPDARHIYESRGFVAGETLSEDDIWGGLTKMRLNLED